MFRRLRNYLLAGIIEELIRINHRLNTMPTNAELKAELLEVKEALVIEIEEVATKLAENGVSQENVDLVRSLKSGIQGIIPNEPTAPPTA